MSRPADLYLGCTAGELVRRAVQRYGDREALVHAGHRFTYLELGERISQYTQALAARGRPFASVGKTPEGGGQS